MLCFHNKASCPFLPEKTTNEAQNQLRVPSEGSVSAVPLHNLSFQSKHYSAWYSLTWPVFAFPRCLLQHFQANSHLIFPTESPNTLPTHTPEKMRPERSSGGSFKAFQRFQLQMQISFFIFLLPTHILKKNMSREIVVTVLSLGIIFFTNWMCFPSLDQLNSP